MHLELNKKSCMYPLKQGVKFLQWRFIITATGGIKQKMNSDKLGKERRRLKALLEKESRGEVEEGTAERSLQAWIANADRGDTFFQQKRMIYYFRYTKGELENVKTNERGVAA